MKKIILIFLMLPVLLFTSVKSVAQDEPSDLKFGGGIQAISLGYDLYAMRSLLRDNSTDFGPIFLKYEYGITKRIGLGLNIGFGNEFNTGSYLDSVTNGGVTTAVTVSTTQKLRTFQSLIRGNYHLDLSHFQSPLLDGLDVYAGLGLGYGFTNAIRETTSVNGLSESNFDSFFDVELSIGARYFLTDNFGAYFEYGRSMSSLQLGINVKF